MFSPSFAYYHEKFGLFWAYGTHIQIRKFCPLLTATTSMKFFDELSNATYHVERNGNAKTQLIYPSNSYALNP
jgi:hypothetical protein